MLVLLNALASCNGGAPAIEWIDAPEPIAPVLERTLYEFDDSHTQEGGFAWRIVEWKARREGAQLLVLVSRATCERPRIDDVRGAALSIDVRPDAPQTPSNVLREMDSGRPILVRGSLRAMLPEETAEYPDETVVVPWEELPPGADVWGLSLRIERREGARIAWRLRNDRDVPVEILVDQDPAGAVDRGCLSLHMVGPDGHLLLPRPRDGRLPAPSVRTISPSGEWTGEIDLLDARDLPARGEVRVVLVYAAFPSTERLRSYVEGVSWPRAWPGALASNELAFRVIGD